MTKKGAQTVPLRNNRGSAAFRRLCALAAALALPLLLLSGCELITGAAGLAGQVLVH